MTSSTKAPFEEYGIVCCLDLDGVLVDFMRAVCEIFTLDIGKWPLKVCSLAEGVNQQMKDVNPCFRGPLSEADIWKQIDDRSPYFWEVLEWTADGQEILNIVREFFGESNIRLVSSPSLSPSCYSGKAVWVQREIPFLARKMHLTSIKEDLAKPNFLLIDDSVSHVTRFREAGGNAFLVPRRWNQSILNPAPKWIRDNLNGILNHLRKGNKSWRAPKS